jgi:hypothetical protein
VASVREKRSVRASKREREREKCVCVRERERERESVRDGGRAESAPLRRWKAVGVAANPQLKRRRWFI